MFISLKTVMSELTTLWTVVPGYVNGGFENFFIKEIIQRF